MKSFIIFLCSAATCGLTVQHTSAGDAARQPVASGTADVDWHSDVAAAWQESQRDGRPLLVFVTRDHCYYCDQMKDRTYCSRAVTACVETAFVPLLIDGARDAPLLRELNVRAYPCTFVISPQAVILARIDGYVGPAALADRLNALRPRPPATDLAREP